MKAPGRRTGLLGGTFDPIHAGHLDLATAAAAAGGLDEVLLIPARVPPHRPVQPQASPFHRFAMVGLAAMTRPALVASDLELASTEPSYTSYTLGRLRHASPTTSQLFFIVGADAFAEIATWKDYPDLLELSHFVVVSRPGFPVLELREKLPDLRHRMIEVSMPEPAAPPRLEPSPSVPAIFLLDAATRDVSSTEIRRRVTAGEPVGGLVPDPVERYIARHRLYRAGFTADGLHGDI